MRLVEGVVRVESVDDFVAKLDAIGGEYDCAVQTFDADYVVDRGHLETAVTHANRAIERGEAVADERAVEILLYAAGRRQIRDALEMGVSEGENEVVVVVDGDRESGAAAAAAALVEERATLGGDPATIRAFFGVSDAELAAAGDLAGIVHERVALLNVEK